MQWLNKLKLHKLKFPWKLSWFGKFFSKEPEKVPEKVKVDYDALKKEYEKDVNNLNLLAYLDNNGGCRHRENHILYDKLRTKHRLPSIFDDEVYHLEEESYYEGDKLCRKLKIVVLEKPKEEKSMVDKLFSLF